MQKPPNVIKKPSGIALQHKADALLLGATFFWGLTFPVVKDAIAVMPVFAFLTCRFALAALLMGCINGLPRRQTLKVAVLPGVLLFLSFAFQTLGLAQTSAANCAFITGLNIVWVALFAVRDLRTWLAVALGVGGLWLLTAPDKGLNIGDGLSVVCSLFIALHIIVLNRLDKSSASGEVTLIQFVLVALLSLAASLLSEDSLLPSRIDGDLIAALAITVLGATIFSFWVQTHYQRHTTAARASLIFIMEPVFAAVFAVMFYGETLPSSAVAGAALVLGAMLIAIWQQKKTTLHVV